MPPSRAVFKAGSAQRVAAVTRAVEGWHRGPPRRTRRLIMSGGGGAITPCVVRQVDDDAATSVLVQLVLWDDDADEPILQPTEGENPWIEARCWFGCKGRHYKGMVTSRIQLDDAMTVTWLTSQFGKQWVMPFMKMTPLTIDSQSRLRISDCNPLSG